MGPDDEMRTLNFVTASRVVEANRTVGHGDVVSIGHDLPTGGRPEDKTVAAPSLIDQGRGITDAVTIAPHGSW